MAFLGTSLGAPSISILGAVKYEKQILIPDSGKYDINSIYNNWSFTNSLLYQNSRIYGRYVLENHFDQGYFNFDNWNGNTVLSTDYTKSGYLPTSFGGYKTNFWGLGNSAVANQALYNYGFGGFGSSVPNPVNISNAVVCSGVDLGTGNPSSYPTFDLYTGTLPSGEITVYGRIGSVNPSFQYTDTVLSFDTPEVYAGGGGGGGGTLDTGFLAPGTAGNYGGSYIWISQNSILALDASYSYNTSYMIETDYLCATNFGASIPSDATINGVEVKIYKRDTGLGTTDMNIKLLKGSVPVGTSSIPVAWSNTITAATYGGPSDLWGTTLTPSDVNSVTFGVGLTVYKTSMYTYPEVDYITLKIYYTPASSGNGSDPSGNGSDPYGNLSLVLVPDGQQKKLAWIMQGFSQYTTTVLQNHVVTYNNFSNFLMTYNKSAGIAKFYAGQDDTPLLLEQTVYLGDISRVFQNIVRFHEDSYGNIGGENKNNPKIITDFGIDSKAWTSNDIDEFNRHRLNGAYFIADDTDTVFPPSSGQDNTSLVFHFPINSSGQLGICDSGNPRACNYYVPLSSGINQKLQEFSRSQFNATALKLDVWVENNGTNPSGYLESRVNFCTPSNYLGRTLYTPTHYWSGYPVLVNSGVQRIIISGQVFNFSNNPSDLAEVSLSEATNAQLMLGAWYKNIGMTYKNDMRLYSAKVKLDSYVRYPNESGNFPLSMSGRQYTSDNFPLYIRNSNQQDNFPVYIGGKESVNNSFPLYIAGGFSNSHLDLFIKGKDLSSGNFPLYICGATEKASMNMYMYSAPNPTSNNSFNMTIKGTNSGGVFGQFPLFIGDNAPSGKKTASMNTYLQAPLSSRMMSNMNMFINSDIPKATSSFPVSLYNNIQTANNHANMFLKGPVGTDGAIPSSGDMNLFLGRDKEGVNHNFPLSISGPSTLNNNIGISLGGANKADNNISIYMNAIGKLSSAIKTYINGF